MSQDLTASAEKTNLAPSEHREGEKGGSSDYQLDPRMALDAPGGLVCRVASFLTNIAHSYLVADWLYRVIRISWH